MQVCRSESIQIPESKVELLWAVPEGVGKFPAILFVHGHMENRVGARIHRNFLSSQRRLNRWGVCLASVSQPGYGASTGTADYCGPKSQEAVCAAIDFLKSQAMIDSQRIAIVGYSRGAIVSALAMTQMHAIRAAILGAGFYDFKAYYDCASEGIRKAIEVEAGVSEHAFELRSSMSKTDKIQTPMMILHGCLDERGGHKEAERFSEMIKSNGLRVETRIYQNYGHHIPFRVFFAEVKKFLAEELYRDESLVRMEKLDG